MRQLKSNEKVEFDELLAEYTRLMQVAAETLRFDNLRARPNWLKFYEVHERISEIVLRLRSIQD